jgi:hypothetical protein
VSFSPQWLLSVRQVFEINHQAGLLDLPLDGVRIAFVHVDADGLSSRPQFERDRTQEGHRRLFLSVGE